MFIFGQGQSFDDSLPTEQPIEDELPGAEDSSLKTYIAGAGYSHRFGADNVLLVLGGVTGVDQDIKVDFGELPFFGTVLVDAEVEQHGGFGSLAHYFSVGDVTLRYGLEGQVDEGEIRQDLLFNGAADLTSDPTTDFDELVRMFTDAVVQFDPTLSLEFGLNLSRFDDDSGNVSCWIRAWARAGSPTATAGARLIQDTTLPIAGSLAPVATMGLTPAAVGTEDGGLVKTAVVRWDAEWSERFFTALEYQHQEIDDYSVGWTDFAIFLGIPEVPEGDLDIVTLSANAWVFEELGLFAEGSLIDSDNESDGGDLPLIPDWRAKFGVTWVSPIDLRVSVTQNLIGSRPGDLEGNNLSSFATTDFTVAWQPFDRHIQLSAGILNIFDEDYHIVHDVPAPGRVFTVNGEIRF
jgi:outer membrane receptor protein involved in Fe transport